MVLNYYRSIDIDFRAGISDVKHIVSRNHPIFGEEATSDFQSVSDFRGDCFRSETGHFMKPSTFSRVFQILWRESIPAFWGTFQISKKPFHKTIQFGGGVSDFTGGSSLIYGSAVYIPTNGISLLVFLSWQDKKLFINL